MSRYIDADALIEELKSRYGAACSWLTGRAEGNDIEGEIRAMASIGMLIECKLTIEKMPTANVRENVTGKWIKRDRRHIECPFCHSVWADFENMVEYFNYCPQCGAKLKGEKNGRMDSRE